MRRPLLISLAIHGVLLALLLWAAGRAADSINSRNRGLVSVDLVTPMRRVQKPAEAPGREPAPPKPVPARRKTASTAKPGVENGPARTTVGQNAQGPSVAALPSGGGTLVVSLGEAGSGKTGAKEESGGTVAEVSGRLGSGFGGNADYSAAFSEIRSLVEKAARRSYPARARRLGLEGVAVLSFSVNPAGQPEGISIVSSSKFELLDDAALEIIRKAGPYPFVPEPVRLPIRFSLDKK